MKRTFFRLAAPLIGRLSTDWLMRRSGRRLLLPFYHAVEHTPPAHIRHLYPVKSLAEFERELDFLLSVAQPISAGELLQTIQNGREIERPKFLLSFDDGLRSFHDIIAPVLLKKGVPAICFLNSDFVDNKSLFYRYKVSLLIHQLLQAPPTPQVVRQVADKLTVQHSGIAALCNKLLGLGYEYTPLIDALADSLQVDFSIFLQKERPYMSSDEISHLIDKGFEFGAHSMDHPLYNELSPDEQVRQTSGSIEDICTRFQLPYRMFAFPFTDAGVKDEFYDKLFTGNNPPDLIFGTAGLKSAAHPRMLQRIAMEKRVNGLSAREVIHAEYAYYLSKKLSGAGRL